MTKINPVFILLLVFIVAFSPILSFVFALKNDMFLGYFPPKFLMAEVIKSGELPLWNPYIAFGLPFYGDMNGAYWNPITWILAFTTGYNAYILTLEVLFYLFVAGYGMYLLSKKYTHHTSIQLIASISYMCCGYIIGHLQHLNWITGAAFLPWCVWAFLNIFELSNVKSILIGALCFYLFISSAHPGLIISGFYFFLALFLFLLKTEYSKNKKTGILNYIKLTVFFLIALTTLSAGLIYGYLDILPHFSRGVKVNLETALLAPTTLQSWISLLLPFSTTKNELFFATDIAMRNCYIGLIFLLFFIYSFFIKKNTTQKFFLFTGIAFALVAMGGVFKTISYYLLPFTGYIRLNGEFSIFAILSFIIVSIQSFEQFFNSKKNTGNTLTVIISIFKYILSGTFLISLTVIFFTKNSLVFHTELITNPLLPFNQKLKNAVDAISFWDTMFLQSIIQFILLSFIHKPLKVKSHNGLLMFVSIDLIIATLLNLPFTGIGKASVATIHKIHQRGAKGIPTPPLQPLILNDTLSHADSALVGEWSFYHKQIGSPKPVLYPVMLKSTSAYYNQVEKDSNATMNKHPFLFFSKDLSLNKLTFTNDSLITTKNIKSFTADKIALQFNSPDSGYLILLQNYYPHWYYYHSKTGIKPVKKAGNTFITAPVKKGENNIVFKFQPFLIRGFLLFTMIVFLIYILFILFTFLREAIFL